MGLPVIDLARAADDADGVAAAIDAAARADGFFYVVGHGVPTGLCAGLEAAGRRFFGLDLAARRRVAMAVGGRAWRGWFPLGGELTSGQPDAKEGYYFGADLPPGHPRVAAGTALHGANLYPAEVPELARLVPEYTARVAEVGQTVLSLMARALGIGDDWFRGGITADPTVLFRIFRYPPTDGTGADWGVAEHTDYGLLTVLHQDDHGGLEVHSRDGWVEAPPIPGSFVCNLGDMLERLTAGAYRSTPHRVRNRSGGERLSFPLFLDPGWDEVVRPLPGTARIPRRRPRWDEAEPLAWEGTYGDYLTAKVARVFPDLFRTL